MSSKISKSTHEPLLFEIGSEELPATNLADIFESAAPGADHMLLLKWKEAFQAHRIQMEGAQVWATPRRLIFFAEKVALQQEKKDQLTKLLSKAESYDNQGAPTEKLLTILKHRNTQLSDTVVSDLNGKEFVFIKKAEPVQKTTSVLPALLESLTKSLAFPKNMKWDDSGFFFPRPIRHTLCFLGGQAIKFSIGRTRSEAKIWIFSKAKRQSFPVSDAVSYFKVLKKQGVIADPVERKKTIQSILEKMADSFKGNIYQDPFLMNEVNFLVENPQGLSAPFHEEFLKLPLEVLTVSMARKQRIFGLVDKSGHVMPRFLAIADGVMTEKDKKLICKNYENILHAKLQDSLFFFKEDTKFPLDQKREELKNLIFIKNAGSMYDKTQRLAGLSKFFSEKVGLSSAEAQQVRRAVELSKCDLLTQMVGEFPELQGVMGKYYALHHGEDKMVAMAVGEQYLPRTANDLLPQTRIGAALSILDKMDLMMTCFGLGLQPTSSMDPYALRRSAAGVVKIVLDQKFNFSLSEFIHEFQRSLQAFIKKEEADKLPKSITHFMKDRFKAIMQERGFRSDVVEAVIESSFDNISDSAIRVQALSAALAKPAFVNACKVVERTSNILKSNKEALPAKPDPALFTEALEKDVFQAYEKHVEAISKAAQSRDFAQATSLYANAFFDILNEFFDKVFINAEDLSVRRNRLALLNAIRELCTRPIADLSKIDFINIKRENK